MTMTPFTDIVDEEESRYYMSTDLMVKIYPPIFILFGVIGNILSAIIWTMLLKNTTAGVFLVAISISNLVGLLLQPLIRTIHHWFAIDIRYYQSICKTLYIFDSITENLSSWLMFAFCLERATRLVHIHTSSNGKKSSILIILLIIAVSFSLSCHVIITLKTDLIPNTDISVFQTSTSLVCGIQTNPILTTGIEFNFFWVQMLIYCLFPQTFILGCSIAIIQMLWAYKQGNINPLLTVDVPVTKSDIELARTALFLGIMQLICTTPISVFKTQVDVIESGSEEFQYTVTAILLHTTYTVKFIVYCIFNTKFRQSLSVLFRTGVLLRQSARSKRVQFQNNKLLPLSIDLTTEMPDFSRENQSRSLEVLKETETSTEQISSARSFKEAEKFGFGVLKEQESSTD